MAHPLIHFFSFWRCDYFCDNLFPSKRHLVKESKVEVAVQSQGKGSRYWRGGHGKEMWSLQEVGLLRARRHRLLAMRLALTRLRSLREALRSTSSRSSCILFLTNSALCLVPKRCCSSMMTKARCLKLTAFCIKACVPIKIGISPSATHFNNCVREMSVQPLGLFLKGTCGSRCR